MTGPILGVGELLFDRLPNGARAPGGAPANFAFHCRQLGSDAAVVSRVGADEPGEALLAWLAASGLGGGLIQRDPARPTGLVQVSLDAGAPTYAILPNAAWDHLAWGDELARLCARAPAVATGTLARRAGSRDAIERAVQACAGVRYLDVNLRESDFDSAMVDSALAGATVAKLTVEELEALNEAPSTLTRDYPDLMAVLVTRGAGGAEWHGKTGLVAEVPGIEVRVADTVGAGDAFGAAVVTGLLAGRPPEAVLREANRYAAEVCRHPGATPKLAWRCDWGAG